MPIAERAGREYGRTDYAFTQAMNPGTLTYRLQVTALLAQPSNVMRA